MAMQPSFIKLAMKRNRKNLSLRKRPKTMRSKNSRRNGFNPRRTQAPVALSTQMDFSNPIITQGRGRGSRGQVQCRIRHREFLATINGSVDFNNTSFAVQPGLSTTFPWLASMARNWENYKFARIGFMYISRSSTNATGTVIMAPDYDSSDAPPTSYQQMSNYQNSVADAPWKNTTCILSTRSTTLVGNNRYVRIGALGNNEDIKLYDIGVFNIATTGQAGTTAIGELWVVYDIILEVPSLQNSNLQSNISSGLSVGQAGLVTTNLLGTEAIPYGNLVISNLLNVVTITGLSIGQYYRLDLSLSATGTITTNPSITAATGFESLSPVGDVGPLVQTDVGAWVMVFGFATLEIATVTLGGTTVYTSPVLTCFSCVNVGTEWLTV
jgi:hypothetical protein